MGLGDRFLKITSSNNGAKNVVVKNKTINENSYYYLKQSQAKGYFHFDFQLIDSLLMTPIKQKELPLKTP